MGRDLSMPPDLSMPMPPDLSMPMPPDLSLPLPPVRSATAPPDLSMASSGPDLAMSGGNSTGPFMPCTLVEQDGLEYDGVVDGSCSPCTTSAQCQSAHGSTAV